MKWKGCGRKWSLPNLRYNFSVYLEGQENPKTHWSEEPIFRLRFQAGVLTIWLWHLVFPLWLKEVVTLPVIIWIVKCFSVDAYRYCHMSGVPWWIITGSVLDDWIYWDLLLQSLVFTINYSIAATLPTSQITRTRYPFPGNRFITGTIT
jgi:hypothetical protein